MNVTAVSAEPAVAHEPAAPPAAADAPRSLLIINPRSGQRRARIVRRKVIAVLSEGGPVDIVETRAAGDAFRAARSLGDPDAPATARIVVLGGDGTVNEVANGLQTANRFDVPIGLIPFGTGNLLAKQYGIPIRRSRAAARVALTGEPQRLDLIHVSYPADDDRSASDTGLIATERRRIMTGIAGAGFDGEIVRRFHASRKKWAPGVLWYTWIMLRVLTSWRSPWIGVTVDGTTYDPARWVVICNTKTVGGPLCFAPQARPDDGQLDVVMFRQPPHARLFSFWWSLVVRGDVTRHRDVQHVTAREQLDLVAVPPPGSSGARRVTADVPCQLDGDPVGNAPIRFRPDRERFLRILAPQR
ncbi:MAG: diacylglycerol kinase family protein [Planctomycetota bacterium]